MLTIKTILKAAFLLALTTLLACGGGGGGSGPSVASPTQDPPTEDPPEEEPPPRQVFRDFTYHKDVRPIVEDKCVTCHQEGDIAPFALDTYESLTTFGAAAAYAIEAGSMPPWPPTPGYTPFHDDRSLSPEEKFILLAWLDSEMPEGDPADYPGAQVAAAESISYDLSLKMPQPYTPYLQPDDHRCFAIEWPETESTFITNVDVVPGEREVVHHVIVSIAEPEDAHHYYAAEGEDGRPGWYCLGAGGVEGAPLPRQVGGWVPGAGREPTPAATGLPVRPGSVMVVQMHYNTLTVEPRPDQSVVLVETADSVERPAHGFLLVLVAHVGQAGVGGWIAARLCKSRPMLWAGIIGALTVAGAIYNLATLSGPAWMWIDVPLIAAAAWYVGAAETKRRAALPDTE